MARPKRVETGADKEALERLRVAIERGGGPSAVANKTGIPLSTLNDYLGGTEMRISRWILIGKTCGVSLDWLAGGVEPNAPESSNSDSISIDMFKPEIIDEPGNFHLIAFLLVSCREFYESGGAPPPTLRMIFDFISPHYISGRRFWQNKRYRIVDLEETA